MTGESASFQYAWAGSSGVEWPADNGPCSKNGESQCDRSE